MSNAQISDSIKPIDRASVHRITSGQVVIDLQTAVKELVENSLDAGATNIGFTPTKLLQRGTTVTVTGLFTPLPVRRKEFERNAKREFGKALALLQAYALVPCVQENQGVRLTVFNQIGAGKKTFVLQTDASRSLKSSVSSLWGPKQVENLVSLDLRCQVQTDKASLKRQGILEEQSSDVYVTGLISKFSPGSGRTSSDRQFFYIQKAFNEVYRTFNANQSPFIVADFRLPTTSCDINVSPDKRTIFIHSEGNLILALKEALEEAFSPARSTYRVQDAQSHASSSRLSSTKNLDILKEEEEIDPLAGIVTEKDQSSELSSTPLDRSPLRAIPSPKPSDHTPTVLQDGTPFRPAEGPPLIEPPRMPPPQIRVRIDPILL
ncbi:hypothetical protein FRB90_012030 [Tulasnella sp. 427]|nr:hypothetical protein FRB90_012030 [Tulasnella sp. 427]